MQVDFFRKGIEGSIPVVTSSQTNVLGTIMYALTQLASNVKD
jgi:hypothetical protein